MIAEISLIIIQLSLALIHHHCILIVTNLWGMIRISTIWCMKLRIIVIAFFSNKDRGLPIFIIHMSQLKLVSLTLKVKNLNLLLLYLILQAISFFSIRNLRTIYKAANH
jgi:hypothetical protein